MNYSHPQTKQSSPVPWSLKEAKDIGCSRYMTLETCPKCKSNPTAKYVVGDTCVQCATKDAKEVWDLWVMGSPDRPDPFPTSRAQAIELGTKSYYRYEGLLCKGGMHFIQPHVLTNKCQGCVKPKQNNDSNSLMHNFPDMVIAKRDAESLGMHVYRTGLPCRRGHLVWRYVSSGACIACLHPKSYLAKMEPIEDLPVITIAEQTLLFLGYAWDNRRMINSDGARFNKVQFNMQLGGPAHFELTNGRKPVRWAFDAFMKNFGPQRHES